MRLILLAALLAATPAYARFGSDEPFEEAATEGPEIVFGVVRREGRPAPGIEVRLGADGTKTDAAGRFRFERPNCVQCILRASAPGLAAVHLWGFRDEQLGATLSLEKLASVTLELRSKAGPPVDEARIVVGLEDPTIESEALLEGVVVERSAPGRHVVRDVPGQKLVAFVHAPGFRIAEVPLDPATPGPVRVTLEPKTTVRGLVRCGGAAKSGAVVRLVTEFGEDVEATTSADGTFVLTDAPPGEVTLEAEAEGCLFETREVRVDEARLVVDLQPAAVLVLRLPGKTGTPSEPVRVTWEHRNETQGADDFAFENGVQRIDSFEAGPIRLMAWSPRHGLARPAALSLEAGRTTHVTLAFQTPRTLTGRVLDASGAPISAARLEARPLWSPEEELIDTAPMDELRWPTTQTRTDGRFSLAGLPPVDLVLSITAPGYGRTDVEAKAGKPLEVVLERRGIVRGRVQLAGAPLLTYDVVLFTEDDRSADSHLSAPCVVTGNAFECTEVPRGPGRLRIEGPRLAENVTPVEVKSPGPLDLGVIAVQLAAVVTGQISPCDEDEVVWVHAKPIEGTTLPPGTHHHSPGSEAVGCEPFELPLPPGRYRIHATVGAGHTAPIEVTLTAGERRPVKLGPARAR